MAQWRRRNRAPLPTTHSLSRLLSLQPPLSSGLFSLLPHTSSSSPFFPARAPPQAPPSPRELLHELLLPCAISFTSSFSPPLRAPPRALLPRAKLGAESGRGAGGGGRGWGFVSWGIEHPLKIDVSESTSFFIVQHRKRRLGRPLCDLRHFSKDFRNLWYARQGRFADSQGHLSQLAWQYVHSIARI
jgi:hypothetical protein